MFLLQGLFALYFLLLSACNPPTNITTTIEVPLQVELNEPFNIYATVSNTSDELQTLVDLDISQSYLKGVAITGSSPGYISSEHFPLLDTRSYSMDLPVEPGQSIKIMLHAVAINRGDHSGTIDFYINREFSFISHSIRTIVD